MTSKKKAIIFDRDGTLIIDKVYLNDPEQITYLDGAFEALKLLRAAGYVFSMATNQSGVARGIVSLENLAEIHRRMEREFAKHGVSFDGIYFAPYSVESNHHMRKPNPGMMQSAAQDHGYDLSQSWMVGDRMTDVEAGRRAGCKTALMGVVDDPLKSEFAAPTVYVREILDVARAILKHDQI